MSSTDELLAPIKASPFLPEMVNELLSVLAEERQRRSKFYEEMTPEMKVEFIEGQVILHSPARNAHLDATSRISTLLAAVCRDRSLGEVKVEKCLCVFPRNDYEPDVVFFSKAKAAGLQAGTMQFPVPDLAVEVLSESTEARDRGVKFADYEAHGVSEYWIVDAEARTVEQYVLVGDKYELRMKSGNGTLICVAISGCAIPVEAIFDDQANVAALRSLLAPPT